jgi:hypothetical protein
MAKNTDQRGSGLALVYEKREDFKADYAMLVAPRGGAVEVLGWIDRVGFDDFADAKGLEPDDPIVIPADSLYPMKDFNTHAEN